MSFMQDDGRGNFVLKLPSVLDLTAAAPLKLDLQAALAKGEGLVIDADAVRRVTSPCLQVLVAAARGFAQTGGAGLRFENVSQAFRETAAGLALDGALAIEGDANG
jgi:anti-anti-sigma regulatory factor